MRDQISMADKNAILLHQSSIGYAAELLHYACFNPALGWAGK